MRSLLSVLFIFLFLATGASAQLAGTGQNGLLAVIERQTDEIENISAALQGTQELAQLQAFKSRLLEIETSVSAAVRSLRPELTEIDSRLAQLGEASAGEDRDISESREKLRTERSEMDSAIKRGHLVEANALQLLATLNQTMTDAFNRNVFENAGSPLSPAFWTSVWQSLPGDLERIGRRVETTLANGRDNLTIAGIILIAASLLIAGFLLGPMRRFFVKMGFAVAKHRAPNTRVRRSGLAAWLTVVGTLVWFFSLTVVGASLRWSSLLPPAETGSVIARLIGVLSFAGFVASLGNALLLVNRSSWRLPPITDDVAHMFRHMPLVAAMLLAIGVILLDTNRSLGISVSTIALSNLAVTGCYCALFGWTLFTSRRLRKQAENQEQPKERLSPLLLASLMLLQGILLLTLVSAAAGYLNLSIFIGRGVIWIAIIAAAAYLLLLAIDDLCSALCVSEGPVAGVLESSFGLRRNMVEQAGILISAILRVAIAFLALVWIFVPFGLGTGDLFAGIGDLTSFTIAGITFEPGSLLRSVLVLAVSVAAVRITLNWLEGTYLPATNLDAGASNSVLMIVKYAGFILAGLWTVNTLGIGMERIALVVSALSVGIGFGLQAITQNFISGLILLAERPLKIGDTIRMGDDEGDVKKISVRSTEIQISDRSTLIVPNSELITKTIRNMTPGDRVGRLPIEFAVPIETDIEKVRQLVLNIFHDNGAVLNDPNPTVLIDSISDGKVHLKCFAFVGSPSSVPGIKSALLFELLKQFRTEDIPLLTG
ncbi:DUF3772 domain-containing protein (plasmid) [Rhizobium leguminosarum]